MSLMCYWKERNVMSYNSNYSISVLTAIFQVDLGYLEPECFHSGFYWS